jgi:hypothetical protein
MLDHTSNSMHHRPRVDPSARALVARIGATELRRQSRERATRRDYGDRFALILERMNAPERAPFIAPIAALAALAFIAIVGG